MAILPLSASLCGFSRGRFTFAVLNAFLCNRTTGALPGTSSIATTSNRTGHSFTWRSDKKVALFAPLNTQFWQRRLILGHRSCTHFDKRQRFAVVSHQIDLALCPSWHIIPCDKNLSVPPQIPIRKRLAAHTVLPRYFFFIAARLFAAVQPTPRSPPHCLGDQPRKDCHWSFTDRRTLRGSV
jgi:hypothetical protein